MGNGNGTHHTDSLRTWMEHRLDDRRVGATCTRGMLDCTNDSHWICMNTPGIAVLSGTPGWQRTSGTNQTLKYSYGGGTYSCMLNRPTLPGTRVTKGDRPLPAGMYNGFTCHAALCRSCRRANSQDSLPRRNIVLRGPPWQLSIRAGEFYRCVLDLLHTTLHSTVSWEAVSNLSAVRHYPQPIVPIVLTTLCSLIPLRTSEELCRF